LRKILFPFELDNPVYKEAYIHGIKLARMINAELIVLNAFKVKVGNDITPEKYTNLKKIKWFEAYNCISKFNQYFLEKEAKTDADLKIKFDYRFVNGMVIDEIRSIAKEDDVDLIVLPISDSREFNRRQLKIIQDNLFEKNRASILVIPYGCEYRPVKNIVFATDLKQLSNFQQYLQDVTNYARSFDSKIHFIHISAKKKAEDWNNSNTYRMVMQTIEKNNRHIFKSLYGKRVIESVNQYVEECNADILVVVKHQHFFLESIFHESFSNEISLKSKVPVMVMREKRI
jgi:nucleotide-binding universal stress UspA family protein